MEKLFRTVQHNTTPQETEVKGTIPEWVDGQLFRIGPGQWDFDDGFVLNHWLDGCALMYKFAIRNGKVDVMSRFLETTAYSKITQIKRPVFTEFGTKSYPDPCKNVFSRFVAKMAPLDMTDNALANVFTLDDDLYVTSETARLWKVNPDDLSCVKLTDLKQVVSINMASSHPLRDQEGTVYNLGASFMTGLKYHIIKISPKSPHDSEDEKGCFGRTSILASVGSSFKTSLSYYHSFGLSERYVLFMEQPLLINIPKMAMSAIKGYSVRDCLEWCPEQKTRFHLVDRVSGQELKTKYQSEPIFFFHHINTYEEDGHLVADVFAFPDNTIMDKFYLEKLRAGEFDTTCQSIVTRFVLPLQTDGEKGRNLVTLKNSRAKAVKQDNGVILLEPETIGEEGFEMATINYGMVNTKKYRYLYGSGVFEKSKFANSLIKMDVTSGEMKLWKESSSMYPGECIYVPRPGSTDEDDGILLCVVLDVGVDTRDFLMVLDARNFQELGRAYVPRSIQLPPSVHGLFRPT